MNDRPSFRIRDSLSVLVAYLVLTLFYTYPLVAQFRSAVFAGSDSMQFLWDFWWMRHSLLELRQSFFFTDYLYHPVGMSLAFHEFSLLNCFLSVPLQSFLGLPAIYNLLVLVSYVLGGFGCYWLVLHLTGSQRAAFVSGIVYAFSSFHHSHASRLHLGSIQWVPFFALFMWKFLEKPSLRHAGIAAAFYILGSLTSWYYMVYLFLWGLVHWSVAAPRLIRQGDAKPLLKGTTAFALLSALAIIPFLLPALSEVLSGRRYMSVADSYSKFFSADIAALFSMAPSHFLTGSFFRPVYANLLTHYTEKYVFLGYIATSLAVAGVFEARARKSGIWVLGLGLFLVLALGPHPQFGGVELSSIRLPYYYLAKLPLLDVMRGSTRCMSMVFLFLAVLAGFGFLRVDAWLRRRGWSRWVWGGSAVCSVLIVAENLPFPLQQRMTPAKVEGHPLYQALRELSDRRAVLDLPLPGMGYPNPMLYQSVHQKPIVGGYVARPPEDGLSWIGQNRVLQYLTDLPSLTQNFAFGFDEIGEMPLWQYGSMISQEPAPGAEFGPEEALRALQQADIGFIVVHKVCYPARTQKIIRKQLERAGIVKVFDDRTLLAYRVDPRP